MQRIVLLSPSVALRIGFVVSWLVLAWPAASSAQLNDFDVDGWVPGVSVWGGMLAEDATGTVSTSDVLGPAGPGSTPGAVQPASDDADTELAPFLSGSIELLAPAFSADWAGRPRLFVHGDVGAVFAQEDDLTRFKDAAPELAIPGPIGGSRLVEDSLLGQGTRTSVKIEPLTWSAGIGIAFETTLLDHLVRIKPSAEYFSQEIQASGIVTRAVALVDPATNLSDFRKILLETRRTKRFHSVGVGLEIEADAARFGSLVTSVFAGARGYATLGSREIAIADFNSDAADPLSQQENARWKVKLDEWAIRGGLGVRVRWSPER